MTTRDKLLGFTGRIRRRDWWMLSLLVGIAQVVVSFALASVVSVAHLSQTAEPLGPIEALAAVPLFVALPIQLAFLWPSVALSVQRYHDRDRSAWPLVIYYVVSIGADFLPRAASGWPSQFPAEFQPLLPYFPTAVSLVAAVWFLITLGFLDGTPGPNRFGPSPKGLGSDPASAFG